MDEYIHRASLFYSYCHRDEKYRERLEVALDLLKDDGLLSDWSDRDLTAGTPYMPEIEKKQDSADLVVFLVSPDFFGFQGVQSRVAAGEEEIGRRGTEIGANYSETLFMGILRQYERLLGSSQRWQTR